MSETPGLEPQTEQRNLTKMSKRVWVINIIFFAVLFGGMFLAPISGIYVAAAVIIVAFIASMLYIYLF